MKQSEDYLLRLRSVSLWSSRAISVPPFVATAGARLCREPVGPRFSVPVFQAPRPFVAAEFPADNPILSGANSA